MPAAEELPSVDRLVRAYQGALVSERRYGDTHPGSIHMHWARCGAALWRRQLERDAEEFRALYFDTAKEERLDAYIEGHFPEKSRVRDVAGEGVVKLTRPNATAGAGTIWAKTRIAVGGSGSGTDPLRFYYVKSDTSVSASTLALPVAVVATEPGPQSKIQVAAGQRQILRIEDPLWDASWVVQELAVEAGTLRERDDEVRPRIKAELFEERYGYESAIVKRMKEVGAATVVLFRSDFPSEATDCGLNRIYVGDANFETSAELLQACRLAIPGIAIAGAGNQALPMTTAWLDLSVAISFWDSPDKFGMAAAESNAKAAVVEYFEAREHQFLWDAAGLRGAIRRAVEDTQAIQITASSPQPTALTMFDAYPLRRYRTSAARVSVSLQTPAV